MSPSRSNIIYRACVAAGFEPRIAFVTRDPVGNSQLVARGLAVTLAPEPLAGSLQGVATVPLEGPQSHRALYALTPASGVRESARAFLAALDVRTPAPADRPPRP